jgi:hypothetical protein
MSSGPAMVPPQSPEGLRPAATKFTEEPEGLRPTDINYTEEPEGLRPALQNKHNVSATGRKPFTLFVD